MGALPLSMESNHLQLRLNSLLRTFTSTSLLHGLQPTSVADGIAVVLFLLTTIAYSTRGKLWDKTDAHHYVLFERPQVAAGDPSGEAGTSRDISQRLEEGTYDCVIFWGSQSGTSERFAEVLGREALSRFGVKALVADLSDYDAKSISKISKSKFAIFILSTYGEGDPSDNTAGLWEWVKHDIQVAGLRYFAFGLGNSNYKYYNRVLDIVADALDTAGASAIMPRQKANDANGGTEEDFQSWKDDIFVLFCKLGYEEKTVAYQPTVEVDFVNEATHSEPSESELYAHHQRSTTNSSIMPLAIRNARELFAAGNRNCIHLELDLGNSDMVYKTGDHMGIWPSNPEDEVDRLLDVLGLQGRRNERLTIIPQDGSSRSKIPSPTTLEMVFRHHLEICGPLARKVVLNLAQFAPTNEAKAMLLDLCQDRKRYELFTATTHVTLARLLKFASHIQPWSSLPLSFVLENVSSLQPRYYSISSSSVISPRRVAITALVVNQVVPGAQGSSATIQGLTSNYLLSASELATSANVPTPTYHRSVDDGSRNLKILAHVRKSKFKLPITSSTPLVMICAGTGFAPFRAFLQERAKLHAIGKPIGRMLLFFGCRNQDDFIYRDEIERIRAQLGDKLEVKTAFSRWTEQRRAYVQDCVAEHTSEVLEMLDAGSSMYVCGKASMARDVDMKLEKAFKDKKSVDDAQVKAWADALKKRGKWKADVWG